MSKKKSGNKKELVITFANEPSKEAIWAYNETVSRIVLKYIQKQARELNP